MTFFRNWFWSINTAKAKMLALERVYDVRVEQPAEDRYLIHIWFEAERSSELESAMANEVRTIMRGRPRAVKIAVLFYFQRKSGGAFV